MPKAVLIQLEHTLKNSVQESYELFEDHEKHLKNKSSCFPIFRENVLSK